MTHVRCRFILLLNYNIFGIYIYIYHSKLIQFQKAALFHFRKKGGIIGRTIFFRTISFRQLQRSIESKIAKFSENMYIIPNIIDSISAHRRKERGIIVEQCLSLCGDPSNVKSIESLLTGREASLHVRRLFLMGPRRFGGLGPLWKFVKSRIDSIVAERRAER